MHSEDLATRCVSWFTVCIVLSLYISGNLAYHWLLKPSISWALLFNLTWLLALWSYLQTSLTDPGTPHSAEWRDWAKVRRGGRSVEQWQKEAEEAQAHGA